MIYQDEYGLMDLTPPRLPGRHQFANAAAAIAAVKAAGFELSHEAADRAMTSVEWPGRMQRLTQGALVDLAPRGAEIWLDGGHNPGAGVVVAEALAEQEERKARPLFLIAGMINTKDQTGYFRAFKGIARHVFTVPVGLSEAGVPNAELAARAADAGLSAEPVGLGRQCADAVARYLGQPGDAAAHPDRRLALSGRRGAGRERHAAGVAQLRSELFQLDLDEGVFAVGRIDHVVLDAFGAEIGRAFLHLGDTLAFLGHQLQLAVHQRHDDVVMRVPVPAGGLTLLEAVLGDDDPVVVDEDCRF